jgi:hypothetical protein
MEKFQSERVAQELNDLALREDIDDELKYKLSSIANEVGTPLQTDPWIYRLVVCFLGSTVLLTVLGSIAIMLIHFDPNLNIPDGVIALGSAAVGALAGLLAPSPNR